MNTENDATCAEWEQFFADSPIHSYGAKLNSRENAMIKSRGSEESRYIEEWSVRGESLEEDVALAGGAIPNVGIGFAQRPLLEECLHSADAPDLELPHGRPFRPRLP